MLACVDVDYRERGAVAGCVLFADWPDAEPVARLVAPIAAVAPYRPGEFYRRELPCLLAVLAHVEAPLAAIIVDGYVWLDGQGRPGLGAHLWQALDRTVPIVGVAKTAFTSDRAARPVLRGQSSKPLYVSAAGLDVERAALHIRDMHGPHRLPTLLKEVDRLCRGAATPAPRSGDRDR
jgi:deoxyribonuclease V